MALIPLESNPEVMTKFIHLLGVPDKWNLVDVYGLDPETLAWVPRPVLALILLYPCNEKFEEFAKQECEKIKDKGQEIVPELFYMRQYVSNACGSVALIHSVANNADRLELKDGAFKKLLLDAKDMTPEQRGKALMSKAGEIDLIAVHQELAMEGQTKANPNEKVIHHFVAFVEKGGFLYELDGSKEFPVNHGPTTQETLLEDAAKVCRAFMERDSEDVNFTIMALTAKES